MVVEPADFPVTVAGLTSPFMGFQISGCIPSSRETPRRTLLRLVARVGDEINFAGIGVAMDHADLGRGGRHRHVRRQSFRQRRAKLIFVLDENARGIRILEKPLDDVAHGLGVRIGRDVARSQIRQAARGDDDAAGAANCSSFCIVAAGMRSTPGKTTAR
jgi:hypothetical protein